MLPIGGAAETVERGKPETDLEVLIGRSELQQLHTRLESLNRDIVTSGLRDFPGAYGKLTGYAYREYFDWDLYFENVYVSYYGVSR
jgi:putative isomerase